LFFHRRHLYYLLSCFFFYGCGVHRYLHSFPTRRSSDLGDVYRLVGEVDQVPGGEQRLIFGHAVTDAVIGQARDQNIIALGVEMRSEEHTSELQSRENLVCRLLLEKKKEEKKIDNTTNRT